VGRRKHTAGSTMGAKPRWGMAVDLKRCIGCQSCTVACKLKNGTPPGVFWTRVLEKEEGQYPTASRTFLPVRCNHCGNAPCVSVCPTGASYKREQDNLVLINQDRCIGCGACVVACPYQARFIPESSDGYYGEELTPYESRSYQKWQAGTAQKCNFCVDHIDKGMAPACVQTCLSNALVFGDLNDPTSEISVLLGRRAHFQPRADLGTDPSIYYLT
jgi:Fe-S-cluster-containing dehydrogenase component